MKRAVLVGCNYPGTNAQLNGCVNDVRTIEALLKEFYGFDDEDITILVDAQQRGGEGSPTGKNIKAELKKMVESASSGDVLVFHFSGHGTQVPSEEMEEDDGKDEAICPTDMNLICDDDLRLIFKPLPEGTIFTMISDCCHSGGMLDHTEVQIEGSKTGGGEGTGGDPFAMLLQMLGKDSQATNRSLDPTILAGMLGGMGGSGGEVNTGNIRQSLNSIFGEDSSAKIGGFMAQLNAMIPADKAADPNSSMGMLKKMLNQLTACLKKPVASNPATSSASTQSGNQATASSSITQLFGMAQAHQKPDKSEQLGDDCGVLVTGCQSFETSADAMPGGDPSKAYGALTHSIETTVRAKHATGSLTNYELVKCVRGWLAEKGFTQNPCLECSQENANLPFIC